jgi:glyceraldehyde-3-phosphate dehydrogenase (NADP+)
VRVVRNHSTANLSPRSARPPLQTSQTPSTRLSRRRGTRQLPSYERAEALYKIAEEIRIRKDELAACITRETGKPITYARAEVDRSIFTFRVAAEEAPRLYGDVLPLDLNPASKGRFALVRRFPLGPISAITPFNFPLNLVAHKVAPAIAAGNTIVLKPSSNAPVTSLMLERSSARRLSREFSTSYLVLDEATT